MFGFIAIHHSTISFGINSMVHAMRLLRVQDLCNAKMFHYRMLYCATKMFHNCELEETVWGFIDGALCKICFAR